MAKKSISIKFSKAMLTKENGKYTITEFSKDDSKDYNLSEILDGLDGAEGLSVTITSEDDVEPIDEDNE